MDQNQNLQFCTNHWTIHAFFFGWFKFEIGKKWLGTLTMMRFYPSPFCLISKMTCPDSSIIPPESLIPIGSEASSARKNKEKSSGAFWLRKRWITKGNMLSNFYIFCENHMDHLCSLLKLSVCVEMSDNGLWFSPTFL